MHLYKFKFTNVLLLIYSVTTAGTSSCGQALNRLIIMMSSLIINVLFHRSQWANGNSRCSGLWPVSFGIPFCWGVQRAQRCQQLYRKISSERQCKYFSIGNFLVWTCSKYYVLFFKNTFILKWLENHIPTLGHAYCYIFQNESKAQVWAFLLWKCSSVRDGSTITDNSWKLYQQWCRMAEAQRTAWITAGANVQSLSKYAHAKVVSLFKTDKN